ncbi:MAG: ATP-binding cassette domain-containing protein [Treponema sp.]|jgi:ABC-type multidrug transport system ATPase subunit|nr:ATP-binding cassette domain-containing protein [Treponema sp.]
MAEIIELKNVNFSAQEGKIVHDVSVKFESSKTTAIVGPSGCGKSTVLKLAAGLLVPDNGEILFKGKNVNQMNRAENLEFRKEGAFVFQDSALWANQTLYQILELPLKIHFPSMTKKAREKRVKAVTSQVGYKKNLDVRPARLSMGEQKLIAFARAMLCNPTLLFLDEWTESLDENSADRLIDIVRRKQREEVSILFVSHDMRIIMDLADNVVVVIDGKISINAPKEEVVSELLLKDFLKIGIAS